MEVSIFRGHPFVQPRVQIAGTGLNVTDGCL